MTAFTWAVLPNGIRLKAKNADSIINAGMNQINDHEREDYERVLREIETDRAVRDELEFLNAIAEHDGAPTRYDYSADNHNGIIFNGGQMDSITGAWF